MLIINHTQDSCLGATISTAWRHWGAFLNNVVLGYFLRHKVWPKLQVVSLKPIEFFSRSSFFQFNQTNFFQSVHRCQMMWLSCKIVFEKCKLCIPPSSQTYSIFDFKIIFNSSFLKRKLRNSLCFNNTYEIHTRNLFL